MTLTFLGLAATLTFGVAAPSGRPRYWWHIDRLDCSVFAPRAAWRMIARWPIRERHQLRLRRQTVICGIRVEPSRRDAEKAYSGRS